MKQPNGNRPPRPPLTISLRGLLSGGSDNEFRALVHGLLALGARLEAARSGFGALIGLTGIQYTVLVSVAHLETEGDVSVRRVADHLHLSGAFVTVETGKLIKQGLLSKHIDPRDRRRVCLRVTRKGSDLLASLAPTQRQINDVLFEPVTADQFSRLRNLVDQMVTRGDRAIALLKYLSNEA